MYYPLKVSKVIKETSSAVSVEFEVSEEQKSQFQFLPGQFLTLKKDIKGEDVRRSYSICTTAGSGQLKVAIKKVAGGLFSTYAVEELKEGDVLEVGAPAGKFTVSCNESNQKNYVFIAAGSGITPVLGMLKTVLEVEPNSKVQLIYGNKSKEETIFFDELQSLKEKYSTNFQLDLVYSVAGGLDADHSGRINSNKVISLVNGSSGLANVSGVYLCGPEDMINEVNEELKKQDSTIADRLFFELFTSTAKKNTEVANEDFSEAKVTARVDDVDYTFMVKAGKPILAAALDAGVDLPYSCQGGVCGSCECSVTKGKVDLQQNMVLSDEEVKEGQSLACQAIPKTSEVSLDFDF